MLDGKLKQLNRTAKYVEKKKAGVITVEMEEKLWESGMLSDHSPQVLADTMLSLNWIELCTQEWRRTPSSSSLPQSDFCCK